MKKQVSTSKQEFKAVEFMRERRDELSDLFANNPKKFWKELDEVRKKYENLFHKKNIPVS